MQSEVLKPLKYAADHINIVHFVVGDVGDFGDSTEGLTKEGFIKPAKVKTAPVVQAEPKQEVSEITAEQVAKDIAEVSNFVESKRTSTKRNK